ncbi:recombinase family protein [Salmonella enterica]|nr:recombinase family protein [Salmonella enterica]EBE2263124.1 recombinase family protein [Salmonella enterica]
MIKTFIYSRVSSQEQLSGGGLDRQETDVREYVTRNGLDQYEIVAMVDRGISGYDGSNMRDGELGKWYKDAITGMYWGSHLVLEAIDRFSRRDPMLAMEDFTVLVNKGGIKVHIVKFNTFINGDNLPMLSMMMNLAHSESKQKSDRISKGWQRRRRMALDNGTAITARTPYWIDVRDNEYRLNNSSIAVVEAFAMYKQGLSCGLIAKKLNELKHYFPYMWTKTAVQHIVDGLNTSGIIDAPRAIKTIKAFYKSGFSVEDIAKKMNAEFQFMKEWNAPAVHKLLQNKSVTGLVEIQKRKLIQEFDSDGKPLELRTKSEGEKYFESIYPQIISIDDFELIQKLLESNRKVDTKTGKGQTTGGTVTQNEDGELVKQFILSSLCRCYKCGGAMFNNIVRSKRKNGKVDTYSYLRCLNERDAHCDVKALNYPVIERAIIEHVKGLNFDTMFKGTNNSELELLKTREVELLRDIATYENAIAARKAAGKNTSPVLVTSLVDAQDDLEALQKKIRAISGVTVNAEELTSLNESVFDVAEYELRNMVELELQKIIKRITFNCTEKNIYFITIQYNTGTVLQHGLKVDKKKGVIETYELHEGNKGYVSNGEVITPALIEAAESKNIGIFEGKVM